VPVWGQAYSPNIGWLNFYCDGSGGARPANISSSIGGADTSAEACGNVAYATLFDTVTNAFSGVAYSPNYGWLNLTGVTLDESNLQGSSDANGMATYNFGTTYFQVNQPNSYNPGVAINAPNAKLCGFAYSTAVGYISLCDTDTTYPLYDFDTYGAYLDKVAPTVTTASETFSANSAKPIILNFVDGQTGLESLSFNLVGANGDIVSCASNSDTNLLGVTSKIFTTTCDLSVAQTYDLHFTTCDVVGNCNDGTDNINVIDDFYTVVAGNPGSVLSTFEFGSPTKIADSTETHHVKLILKDSYGNAITSVAGVKEVKVNFYFNNTTKLDQIAKTGDAAKYTSSEFSLNQEGGDSTGFLTEVSSGDGVWQIDVASFTPTSAGYSPISNDGFDLDFDHIDYEIIALGGKYNIGEGSGSAASGDAGRIFDFAPTLTTTPEAMNFTSDFTVTEDADENITINAPKRFQISFENASSNFDADNPELGLVIDSNNPNITWGEAAIEKINSTLTAQALNIDSSSADGFNQAWNDFAEVLPRIPKDTEGDKTIRIRTTPILLPNTQAPENLATNFITYLSYEVNGKSIKHKGAITNLDLYNPSLSVSGLVSTEKNISGKQENSITESFGDIARAEAKVTVDKNTQSFIKDSNINSKAACKLDLTITQASDFNRAGCLFTEKTIAFVNGKDVYLDGAGSSITLPSGKKTILISGGNLHIKSNLTYASRGDSFGIILRKDAAGKGGNIYIYPDVTNVVGAFYAEGSVISVNTLGKSGEDSSSTCSGNNGFCDRSFELRNQLYLKGSFATVNTVGGSDKNPFECPTGITCTSRTIARFYDLTYLRTYHTEAGGNRAVGLAVTNNNAVTIEYDNRIQTTPPPLFSKTASTSGGEIGY